ncbi:restriction endonuclease subunit S [Bacillus sp. MB2021]|uniref:restriction endonuclease subunit S n=1 Tax=Bacillus sp. MB2021 TaxID=1408303 RepID=UPI0004E15B61|nr:restriction endonuclease subunit S [Bacillus sp. MB2021]
MSDKITKSPQIRFAEFTDVWEQRKLGAISEKVTEKNKNNIYSETLTNSAEFGIINQRDFFDKDISNEKNLDGYYVVHPDDFVYNPRISNLAPVGPIKRNKLGRTGVMSPLYYVFRTHNVDKTYLEKYFSSNSWQIFMKLNGDSGARSDRFAIKDSIFREMPIPIPSIKEQTKIGNFFDRLDHLITLNQRKYDKLVIMKKSMLEKMFPKDGANVPEIRFAGFNDAWERRGLGEVFEQTSNYVNPKVENLELWSLTVENGLTPKTERYNREFLVRKEDQFKSVSDNEFIYNPMNMTLGAVDLNLTGKKVAVSGYYITMKTTDNYDSKYFGVWLKTPLALKMYKLYATGSLIERQRVQFQTLSQIKASVPSKEEQVQIGNFFYELDNLITLHRRELNSLKNMKKSLLQQMFI